LIGATADEIRFCGDSTLDNCTGEVGFLRETHDIRLEGFIVSIHSVDEEHRMEFIIVDRSHPDDSFVERSYVIHRVIERDIGLKSYVHRLFEKNKFGVESLVFMRLLESFENRVSRIKSTDGVIVPL